MALAPLATVADLLLRVAVDDADLADEMLAVASSVVRGAAQSPILTTASVVTLWGKDQDVYLDLPGKPVTAVTTVVFDGTTLDATDYKLVDGRLWRSCGWGGSEPLKVVVTMTHGFAATPAHIRNLVCDLAIAGIKVAPDGARTPGVIAESIDDYSVTFAQGAEAVASVMELPVATRNALRKAFGGGVALLVSR